jgi:hypothetical protein
MTNPTDSATFVRYLTRLGAQWAGEAHHPHTGDAR